MILVLVSYSFILANGEILLHVKNDVKGLEEGELNHKEKIIVHYFEEPVLK